ncbi:MAG: hypothetical protein V2A76_07390 [Planctomycetota bacterium]
MAMETEGHFYSEDPSEGPPDARTDLRGVDYFFLGNGLVQGAVQVDPSGAGTPLGLLLLHPEWFGPKRTALTFDPETGLAGTVVRIEHPEGTAEPLSGEVDARWTDVDGIPAVRAGWRSGDLSVTETFYCPDRTRARLVREVSLRSKSALEGVLATGQGERRLERTVVLRPEEPVVVLLRYDLEERGQDVTWSLDWHEEEGPDPEAVRYWTELAALSFDSGARAELLDRLYSSARRQLPAVLSAAGAMDGSIWQYNLEWVRDQANVVVSLCQIGAVETARKMLARLLGKFVTEAGDTVDSSRWRPPAEVELDQNGILLMTAKAYVDWTGDLALVAAHWPKIRALAEYPLRDVFRHGESGLLKNQREYWERHAAYGIEEGMELTYQLFVSLGLLDAAELAGLLGHPEDASRWRAEADRLKQAMLFDPKFSLVERGIFIKRRRPDGTVQETVTPTAVLPVGLGIDHAGPHYLNPDTASVLPIVTEFIDPRGDLARRTLEDVERLWNQTWDGGGYCRYNVTSEADSPGPWPFATLFVARAYLEAGDDRKVWRILEWLGSVPSGGKACTWFEFYGEKKVPPCPPIGITPWTWAEVLTFFIHHLLGVRPGPDMLELRPRLLEGLDRVEASLAVRGHRLHLTLRRAEENEAEGAYLDGAAQPLREGRFRTPIPEKDLRVELVLERKNR